MSKLTLKMMFIGNSHTFYNDMPYMIKYLSDVSESKYNVEPFINSHGGWILEKHKVEPEIRFNILYGNYDYVVIQQGSHPFPGKDALLRDGAAINEFISATGAKPICYMTWSEKDKPWNQSIITESYHEFAQLIGGILCPAGLAFQKIREAQPEVELYDTDGEHANQNGSYLVSCVFYSIIHHSSPEGLTGRITYGNELICDISQDILHLLQKTAWDTVQEFVFND